MYAIGIDLGTTFTAAAIWRNGRAEIVSLGSRSAAIPSVVLLREDETFLTGDTANRRGLTEPHRVAREFKRRLGDTTPILLGGVPYSAEALMSRLLRSVIDEVVSREGGPPSAICVSHPANWGQYKTDLLRQAVRMSDLDASVSYTTEPEAAAVNYAQEQRLGVGAIVAVYDLGGGTFDAAVLRRTNTGFAILGQPEGIERLGGIDFDAAVFNHVVRALGGKLEELDEDDPTAVAAVARLREECVQAKEALSSDTDTSIPVLLPNLATEVRLTRSELESMVRPALHGSIDALRRAVRSAGCTPDQLHSVLLVGGSSRMPIVAQLVGSELGRPVAVDAHPKHAVALGAAWLASGASAAPAAVGAAPTGPGWNTSPGLAMPSGPQRPPEPTTRVPPQGGHPHAAVLREPAPMPAGRPVDHHTSMSSAGGLTEPFRTPRPPVGPPPTRPEPKRRRGMMVAAAVAVVVLLGVGGVALKVFTGGTQQGAGAGSQTSGAQAATTTTAETETPTSTAKTIPPDEQCTDAIKSNPRWVCLTSAVIANGKLTVEYEVDFAGAKPNINGGYHLHIYGGDGTTPPDHTMGSHAPASEQGKWYVEDREKSVISVTDGRFTTSIRDAPKVCARIATSAHRLVPDTSDTFKTGNCVPITRP